MVAKKVEDGFGAMLRMHGTVEKEKKMHDVQTAQRMMRYSEFEDEEGVDEGNEEEKEKDK